MYHSIQLGPLQVCNVQQGFESWVSLVSRVLSLGVGRILLATRRQVQVPPFVIQTLQRSIAFRSSTTKRFLKYGMSA